MLISICQLLIFSNIKSNCFFPCEGEKTETFSSFRITKPWALPARSGNVCLHLISTKKVAPSDSYVLLRQPGPYTVVVSYILSVLWLFSLQKHVQSPDSSVFLVQLGHGSMRSLMSSKSHVRILEHHIKPLSSQIQKLLNIDGEPYVWTRCNQNTGITFYVIEMWIHARKSAWLYLKPCSKIRMHIKNENFNRFGS